MDLLLDLSLCAWATLVMLSDRIDLASCWRALLIGPLVSLILETDVVGCWRDLSTVKFIWATLVILLYTWLAYCFED